jgi:hypothetical protein
MLSTRTRLLGTILLCCAASACSGMRADQHELIPRWESQAAAWGHPDVRYQEIKDPTTAAWLGVFLPGAGGFYTHRPGLGVAGLLTWPISLIWEPTKASAAAYDYNFWKFRDRMIDLTVLEADADERTLEGQLTSKQILPEVYQARRDRLRDCKERLDKIRGLKPAIQEPAAINQCLDEVAASSSRESPG